jgi:alpha-galactosidase
VLRKAGHGDVAAEFPLQRKAYKRMHDALVATGRPIVLSLCQYGMDSVWEWRLEVGGSLWHTTGDISDKYDRMPLIGFQQAGLRAMLIRVLGTIRICSRSATAA